MNDSPLRDLRRLARFCGIKLDYWDTEGKFRVATEPAMLAVLRALGHEIASPEDAGAALALLRAARWRGAIAPVTVLWEGEKKSLRLRLSERAVQATLKLTIDLESGKKVEKLSSGIDLLSRSARKIGGEHFAVCEWPLPANLPLGYHKLLLEYAGGEHRGHLIVAPERAFEKKCGVQNAECGIEETNNQNTDGNDKGWGIFLPLYALRMQHGMGAADWSDFQRLTEWVEGLGGEVAATLPMLAGFLGNGPRGSEPGTFEYSPYSPASRLFLNEFYIHLNSIPEFAECIEARKLMESPEFRRECEALNAASEVDYRRQMALKRRVLELLAKWFYENADEARIAGFEKFNLDVPDAREYARFRAVGERRGESWWVWPQPLHGGTLEAEDADPKAERYHLYVQWVAFDQMNALSQHARAGGRGLYLDMPLGVNSDGYDVWRNRELFALKASGGAPPDGFFSKGQDWGFPPLHPERSRVEGHRYWASVIRRLMRQAGVLRIDHVMGLHRLYWVPQGMGAKDGLYVRYPHEDFYAILALESRRFETEVVGENLGTVPPAVPAAMARHAIRGMHVMQFGVSGDWNRAIDLPKPGVVASINTHDTATFAGWWLGRDLDLQLEMGLINPEQHRRESEGRGHVRMAMAHFLRERGLLDADESPPTVHGACLKLLASGGAGLLLVNIEDLWGEPAPQNVPGTGAERPNWRRRAAIPFEAWTVEADFVRLLKEVDQLRRTAK